jgi:RNA polymerase sigma-70 factor (sigma-E family)
VRAEQEPDYVAYVTGRLPGLRRAAAQLAGDPHRGDDLVQQAVTRLYQRWRSASQASNLDAYVYKILVRVFLDERRLRWSLVRLQASPTDGPNRSADDVDTRLLLHDALGGLPKRQRAVVVLRYLCDLSVDDVATILEVSAGTVKSQTSAGLTALRRLLDEHSDDASRPEPEVLT